MSVWQYEVFPGLDIVDFPGGNVILLDGFASDVSLERFFAEQVAAAANAMLERNGINGETAVFIDRYEDMCINWMEDNFKGELGTEVIKQGKEDVFHVAVAVDMEWGSASQQPLRGNQSNKSKAMVSVEVADEDVRHTIEIHMVTTECELCTLRAVNEKIFFTYVDELCATVVP